MTAYKHLVQIITGSDSDLAEFKKSNLRQILDACDVSWQRSVISAHRHPEVLRKHCEKAVLEGAQVFIGVAGMSAQLPGAIASNINFSRPVLGVALESDVLDGMDAMLSITRMPTGCPVLFSGIGTAGLNKAALSACQIIALTNQTIAKNLATYIDGNSKPAIVDESNSDLNCHAILAEGKTKRIHRIDGTGDVFIYNKDDITAGDGARRTVLLGKGAFSNTTTVNVFELLNRRGISTHFVSKKDRRTFRARQVNMIPIEFVARRIPYGSYLKRNPAVTEGERFQDLVLECFLKDDARHDPIMIIDLAEGKVELFHAKEPISASTLIDTVELSSFATMKQVEDGLQQLEQTFLVLEQAWTEQDTTLVDLKIESGMVGSHQFVADVIDNDSWRIWPDGKPERMLDKQVFRDLIKVDDESLREVLANYATVANATNKFRDS